MSGIFKNFSKVIDNTVFSNFSNKYLVKFRNSQFNPTNYYKFPTYLNGQGSTVQGNKQADIFEMSLQNYELCRQIMNYKQLIQNDSRVTASLKNKLNEVIQKNTNLINHIYNELFVQVSSGLIDYPIDSCINIIYVLAHYPNLDQSIFSEKLLDILMEKLKYASAQNLIDLLFALNLMKYYDNEQLWDLIISTIQQKQFPWEYEEVKYHGWNLDVYEQLSNKEISKNKKKISKSYIEKSLNYGSTLAPIYRCFYQLTSQLRFKILHRLFYKEKRISYDPHEIDAVEEKKLFFKNLEELSSKISKIEPLIKDLKARRSYY